MTETRDMKGTNKITLNQQTVDLAILEYLEKALSGNVHLVEFKPISTYAPYSYEATICDALPEQTETKSPT